MCFFQSVLILKINFGKQNVTVLENVWLILDQQVSNLYLCGKRIHIICMYVLKNHTHKNVNTFKQENKMFVAHVEKIV